MTNDAMERAIEFLTEQAAAQSARIDRLMVAIDGIRQAVGQDAENIRGLVRIAELHHERLVRLEGETE